MTSIISRTEEAIFQKGFKEPYLRSNEKPFIKLLNWYTGIGKTYNASLFAVDLLVNCDVIPVFIAPLQSLVSGFSEDVDKHQKGEYADEIEAAVRKRGANVPVHRLYSNEYHRNDREFFASAQGLARWLYGHPGVAAKLGRNEEDVQKRLGELRSKSAACYDSPFLAMSESDDAYQDTRVSYLKAADKAIGIADSFTWQLIKLDVSSRKAARPEERYMKVPEIRDMVRRTHPLQLFLDEPGIIVTTASKAEVAQQVFAPDQDDPSFLRKRPFANLPEFLEDLNRDDSVLGRMVSRRPDSARVVTFVDEEEDSYWFLFERRKSVVNSADGRNDLNVVLTEFFTFFDLKWPMAFERAGGRDIALAKKVYEHLEDFATLSTSLEAAFDSEKATTGAQYIAPGRKVAILREQLQEQFPDTAKQFEDDELLAVLQELHERNDAHTDFTRFRQKARVLERMRGYVKGIKRDGLCEYESFRALRELVFDKKYFTMSRSTYGEVLDQPGQTFFTETASVMDTEFLRQVELRPDTAHQTVRLHYHESEAPANAYTLLDYLQLVVFMAKVLAQDGPAAVEFDKKDIERYPKLSRFRNDVRRLFKESITDEGMEQHMSEDELLTESFLFEKTKSVVTLEESWWQPEEYNLEADVSLTLTITSLRATPEEDIVRALGRTNGVYLMSATGGLPSASSGAFNTRKLQRVITEKGGVFSAMSDEELAIVSRRAHEMLALRERRVTILDDKKPRLGFGVSPAFKGLLQAVLEAAPDKGEDDYAFMNHHKEHEVEGLVASLDRLLTSDLRSGLVLCQTVKRIKACLRKLAKTSNGFVEEKDSRGDYFVIHPEFWPSYKGHSREPITLILYTGPRFRNNKGKTGAVDEKDDAGQFNKELTDALDISHHKVLLWSAYQSASRGINFITTQGGEQRDFELFCLLNDPFYTRHTRPSGNGFSMEMFQSFAQVVRDENDDWAAMSRGDLLYQYSRNRWKRLRKEHVIDITRTIFQSLGRGERRPQEKMPCQFVYLSSEAARTVHLGLRHAPELVQRASPAQHAVLVQLRVHNEECAIFTTPAGRAAHATASLKLGVKFRKFTSETPARFRSDPQARAAWSKLFDELMFKDPVKYLAKLQAAGIPAEFRDACYLEVPVSADVYTREVKTAELKETVVTDSVDGEAIYEWTDLIASGGLVSALSEPTRKLLMHARGFDAAATEGRTKLLPQPWFVTEIMKGYIAELEFEQYIGTQFNAWQNNIPMAGAPVRYFPISEHPNYAQLYQLFDYYLEAGSGVVVGVDMKNWARSTDSLNKQELMEVAQKKHATLCELLPGMRAQAVYVNLHGAHKYSVVGGIRFMSLFVPGTRMRPWAANQNLREALLGK